MHHFHLKNKKISGDGHRPSPDPSSRGRGNPSPDLTPDLAPSNENFWVVVRPCTLPYELDSRHIDILQSVQVFDS